MVQVAEPIERDAVDDQVEEAIRLCGGDMREAIWALILDQHRIESELAGVVSAVYVRRKLR